MGYQSGILAVIVVLGIFTISLHIFRATKVMKYKNDERWQLVQNKANHTAMRYNNVLGFIICVGYITTLFVDPQMTLSLSNMLECLLLALFLRDTVEFFALRHFDKVM